MIQSGPVTAGVLRGDRARFQLFGDTVNTAARLEGQSKTYGVDIVIGPGTEAIAGEGKILTAGGFDAHIHFICPQQIEESLYSGITTMLGGGTGPATGTYATTCTPGPWHIERMLQAADAYPMNLGFLGKGNASTAAPLLEQIKAGAIGEMDYSKMEWVLSEPPSFYARRNCYYGASFPSLEELNGREEVGLEQICWGNDYPHYEGTFPYNTESLQLTFGHIPDRERRMILGENAAKLLKL